MATSSSKLTVTVPLTNGVYKNVDEVALTDRDAILVNCYVDELGFCNKRPGAKLIEDFTSSVTTPINGAYWWKAKSKIIVTTGGKVALITKSGESYSSNLTSPLYLTSNTPVTFTEDENYIFAANGGRIVYWNGAGSPAQITSANAPTVATHIGYIDDYLIAAGDGTNKFYWADVSTPLTWSALNYASASGNADPITALKVFERKTYLFGISSFEIWENRGDVDAPFQREAGGFYEVGCIAPYSIIEHNQDLYWLSDKRRFVKFGNGTIQNISTQYDKEIAQLSGVNGCVASSLVINGRVFLVFNFQDADRTLVYDIAQEKWHEWDLWDPTRGERGRWIGNCAAWSPVWGENIVGDRKTARVYEVSDKNTKDGDDLIRLQRLTGKINYGTQKKKRSDEIRVRIKRGVGLSDRTPKIAIRWQDDGKPWSNYHDFSLGNVGETSPLLRIKGTGIYTTRQYELVVSDDVPVVFGEVQEDITLLR